MTWLTSESRDATPAGEKLAALIRQPGIVTIPGAHNALAAMLVQKAGFQALYLSGAALTASLGLPDLGILGLEELSFFTRTICRATALPLIVDGDTGFGGILNVMRAVRELEDAGAAAIQIEDQLLPKKCGHLNDKHLVAPDEMARKVSAAFRARDSGAIARQYDGVRPHALFHREAIRKFRLQDGDMAGLVLARRRQSCPAALRMSQARGR